MLPHEIIDKNKIKIDNSNVRQFYPCFGRYSYMNCYNLGYPGFPLGYECPLKRLCIKRTNEWRREQKEILDLDKPHYVKENMTRAERMLEMGKRPSTKHIEKTGYDIIGYMNKIRKEREEAKRYKEKQNK